MADLHKLLTGHRFKVTMSDAGKNNAYFTCGFKSVRGVKIARAYEPLAVGGKNDGPVLLPLPVKEPGRLTLEHGKAPKERIAWFEAGRSLGMDVLVSVLDETMEKAAEYALKGAVIESVELSALDALSSEVLIESVTILCSGIRETI
ncbi:MAG: phage tail protein [Clostridiales Family XIII bacterium]|jgi:phage tail-like protein|nr:phage tail protein [Clostridiales Family XIII bacterium]